MSIGTHKPVEGKVTEIVPQIEDNGTKRYALRVALDKNPDETVLCLIRIDTDNVREFEPMAGKSWGEYHLDRLARLVSAEDSTLKAVHAKRAAVVGQAVIVTLQQVIDPATGVERLLGNNVYFKALDEAPQMRAATDEEFLAA